MFARLKPRQTALVLTLTVLAITALVPTAYRPVIRPVLEPERPVMRRNDAELPEDKATERRITQEVLRQTETAPRQDRLAVARQRWKPVDIVVFAPHPDDETLGCGAIIQQAVKAGKRVHVVIFTNGDGFPEAAAQLRKKQVNALKPEDFTYLAQVRQEEVAVAMPMLGINASDVTFLGYPDTALLLTFTRTGSNPAKSGGRYQTYGPGQPEYHRIAHGGPAQYLHQNVVADVAELLELLQSSEVYVTDETDHHPDHKAAFRFVMEAARAVRSRAVIRTYLIHGGHAEWPWPEGRTPNEPFQAHKAQGIRIPVGVPWPPPIRVPVTEAENARKLQAIRAYASQVATFPRMESYIKSEEIFWTP